MYALNLDPETGRILSATLPQYAPESQPRVEALPEGNISDYLYTEEGYTYDPLPRDPEQPDEITLLRAQVQALSERNEFMEDCIAEMAEMVYA